MRQRICASKEHADRREQSDSRPHQSATSPLLSK